MTTTIENIENNTIVIKEPEKVKRPRGRPKKYHTEPEKTKRPRGRPKKYHTEEERAEANRQGYTKCMTNPNNKAIRDARYKAWYEKDKVEIARRRKIVRDIKKAEREQERLQILNQVRDVLN